MVLRISAAFLIYNIPYTVLVKRFCVARGGLCGAVGRGCSRSGECWSIFAAVRTKVNSWLFEVLALAVAGNAGLLGSSVSGLSQCRVAAFSVCGLLRLANFFITISHCAWRRVISWSLATKKRSKENAFNPATLSVHSVHFLFIGAPKARCSPEPPMCETLLLANPDIDTLRHQCSRASTICPRTGMASRVFSA
jgi:hypothetical protein